MGLREQNSKMSSRPRKEISLAPLLQHGPSPLDLATIRNCLRLHVAVSHGKIEESITADSVETFAE